MKIPRVFPAWVAVLLFFASGAEAAIAELGLPYECIMKVVAREFGVTLRDDLPVPAVFFQSRTPLSQFQDALEPQWGFRPDNFTNAFAWDRNEIFLIDDGNWYERVGRFIDDSFAHELVHFLQVRYRGYDLRVEEFAELEAISIQSWFRDTVMKSPEPMSFCSE